MYCQGRSARGGRNRSFGSLTNGSTCPRKAERLAVRAAGRRSRRREVLGESSGGASLVPGVAGVRPGSSIEGATGEVGGDPGNGVSAGAPRSGMPGVTAGDGQGSGTVTAGA